MSSETLNKLLKYWTDTKSFKEKGCVEIPFDIESFCAENDAEIERLRELVPEWIGVDKYPIQDREEYLVYGESCTTTAVALFSHETERFTFECCETGEEPTFIVEYIMPLPKPPTEVG